MTTATTALALRSRYMAAALRLNAVAKSGPTGSLTADTLRWNLQSLVNDMRDVDDLGQLPSLAQSALVCAAAMSNPNSPVSVPLLAKEPISPNLLLQRLTAGQVLLLSPRTAYNLACALVFLDQGAEARITRLLKRAKDQKGVAEGARHDPFFQHVKDKPWFTRIVGPDPASELETCWLTKPYAQALAPTTDLDGLKDRLKTDPQLATTLQIPVGRLLERADLLANKGDPMESLELLDQLAVRSPETLAIQNPAALHNELRALGGKQTQTDVATWIQTAKTT
jgi:hypothetical protein